ncbi:hypothetical protein BXZ70DRAFT_904133 [Cristinia sonorae]|uniref:Ubiquitin-like domain-containing protein n=1 Tax=Cristinia sonorae TaxID=1940300 RepID=A0A8K0UX50_9AGAR|nr:hypothetical protein BXZ70DRAFT_904133 [Cristinia sonorae]
MSSVDLKVELPTHSLSFHINVPQSSTIRHVKEQIQLNCPGAPRVEGQRVIWRGRFLKDDETVQNIWKSPSDSPVVHLSVHPSAWNSMPPAAATQQQVSATTVDPKHYQPQTPRTAIPSPPPSVQTSLGGPLPYIVYHHNTALYVLIHGKPPSTATDASNSTEARSFALSVLHAYGMAWPRILDEAYPPVDAAIEGVKYEQVVIDNAPFLSLTTPDATPSPCQAHALNILRVTYALLSIPTPEITMFPSPSPPAPYQVTPNTNLNHHLQQLGLPALRLAPNQNPNRNPADPNNPLVPEMRAIPIRALMVPLIMLTFRTVLLMYFFSPSKRPMFGIFLCGWILYEAWNAFRLVLRNGERPGRDRDGVGAGDNADAAGDPAGRIGAQPPLQAGVPIPGLAGNNRNSSRSYLNALIDKFANFQLISEELTLIGDPANTIPPSTFHRIKTFCVLLLSTLHPAVWDRRRTYLRRREGRLRGEAHIRTGETNEEDQSEAAQARARLRSHLGTRHERRPTWVREYIERAVTTEWVDDL